MFDKFRNFFMLERQHTLVLKNTIKNVVHLKQINSLILRLFLFIFWTLAVTLREAPWLLVFNSVKTRFCFAKFVLRRKGRFQTSAVYTQKFKMTLISNTSSCSPHSGTDGGTLSITTFFCGHTWADKCNSHRPQILPCL